MNGIEACSECDGNGFVRRTCGCREAACPHESVFGDGTEPRSGIYQKFWVRRTDGSSGEGGKHEDCDYFVIDWKHDRFAVAAALAYADACEAQYPELASDLRARAAEACRKPAPSAERKGER